MKDSHEVANGICTMNFAYDRTASSVIPTWLLGGGGGAGYRQLGLFDAMRVSDEPPGAGVFPPPMLTDTTAKESLASLTVSPGEYGRHSTSGMNEAYC